MEFEYVYVLQSKRDGKFYIGRTSDLHRRMDEHTRGENKSTKGRLPLRLVYYEAGLDKKKAVQRELYFKTGYGRRFLRQRI